MADLTIETAVVRRYVAALERLRNHSNLEVRTYANEVLDALADAPVHEIMTPLVTLPIEKLIPTERVLRFTVETMTHEASVRHFIQINASGHAGF